MIEQVSGMPDGTIGVRAWGTLTKADYTDALLPPLLELLGRDQKVRLLFQLGPDFDELEPGGDLGGREVRGPPGDPAPVGMGAYGRGERRALDPPRHRDVRVDAARRAAGVPA